MKTNTASNKSLQMDALESWVKTLVHRLRDEDKEAKLMRKRKIVTNHNYYRGNQTGTYSSILDTYITTERNDGLRTLNFVRALVKRVAKEWERARTRFFVHSRSDKPEKAMAAMRAQEIAEAYYQKLFTASFRQRECKFAQLSGEYYRYWWWDKNAGDLKPEPIFEEQDQKIGEDQLECANCQAMFPFDTTDSTTCPQCGRETLLPTLAPTAKVPVQVGVKMVPMGDVVLESVDPLEIEIDLHARSLQEAQWLIRRRLVRREVLEALFPDIELPKVTDRDEPLQLQRMIESAPGAPYGSYRSYGQQENEHLLVFEQIWLERPMYMKQVSPVTMEFPSGLKIEKGQKLIEAAPQGLYIARVHNTICDMAAEAKNDHWGMAVNDLIAGSLHGDGIEDIIELQDYLNDLHSLVVEHTMAATCPPTLYDRDVLKLEQAPNKPGVWIPINKMPGQSLHEAIYPTPPQGLDNAVIGYQERIQRYMLEFAGAFSLEAGAPDVNNRTARAAQLTHDAAQALVGLQLSLREELDQITMTGILKLAQQNWSEERHMPLLDVHGQMQLKAFQASDIPADFIVTVEPGSSMPRSQTEEKEDFVAALQLGILSPATPPEIQKMGARIFNLRTDQNALSLDEQVAYTRLLAIKEAVALVEQEQLQLPPNVPPEQAMAVQQQLQVQAIMQAVPVEQYIDEPIIQTAVIQRFLKSDEGLNAKPLLKQALIARIEVLKQLAVITAQQQVAMANVAGAGAQAPNGNAPTPSNSKTNN